MPPKKYRINPGSALVSGPLIHRCSHFLSGYISPHPWNNCAGVEQLKQAASQEGMSPQGSLGKLTGQSDSNDCPLPRLSLSFLFPSISSIFWCWVEPRDAHRLDKCSIAELPAPSSLPSSGDSPTCLSLGKLASHC